MVKTSKDQTKVVREKMNMDVTACGQPDTNKRTSIVLHKRSWRKLVSSSTNKATEDDTRVHLKC